MLLSFEDQGALHGQRFEQWQKNYLKLQELQLLKTLDAEQSNVTKERSPKREREPARAEEPNPLHSLQQYLIKLPEYEKNRKLNDLLDLLDYVQVIIFVKSTLRAIELDKLLCESDFPSVAVHSGISREKR